MKEKIHLQVQDVAFLQKRFLEASFKKLDLHLPNESESKRDPLKEQVRELLSEFVDDLFESNKDNLLIDDLHSPTIKEALKSIRKEKQEPFDDVLNQRLRKTYNELEEQTVKVSQLRKTYPILAKQKVKQYAAPDQINSTIQDTVIEGRDDKDNTDDNGTVSVPDQSINILQFEASLSELSDLKESLGETSQKCRKLEQLIDVLGKRHKLA
ncbi:BA75_02469T0 [Komagataella pastoris]|uniref:BA75_02469T0 n=1 Tax=Komagataella pastoris TaxID=4922 RepID=A0A1B2JAK4_PICPA|nr:BA75_02469T0 [Komagataella pastoris]